MEKIFKVTYSRGSGPGGQHKNKVETCVEIIHLPSGMKERSQDTRSRARNEKLAMGRLVKRIKAEREKIELADRNALRKHQIYPQTVARSYNYPRNEVKDHRTGKKADLKKIMNGNLDLLK